VKQTASISVPCTRIRAIVIGDIERPAYFDHSLSLKNDGFASHDEDGNRDKPYGKILSMKTDQDHKKAQTVDYNDEDHHESCYSRPSS